MRILDKNKDFYDYLQNIYRDDAYTFDRRDSYNLSKREFATNFSNYYNRWYTKTIPTGYFLLQICNTFWLFYIKQTEFNDADTCINYEITGYITWKNYNAKRKLILLSVKNDYLDDKYNKKPDFEYWKNKFLHMEEPKFGREVNKFTTWQDNKKMEKHIPILKDIGVASFVEPLDIYLALEEYFSKEKTESERTESIDLTNKEKIENHGFDTKTSFRGKT